MEQRFSVLVGDITKSCAQAIVNASAEALSGGGGGDAAIHAAGPVWQGGKKGEPALLAACYRNALRLCEERGIETVDFPSLSTGVFRYPVALAATVAEKAILEHLRAHALPCRVRIVCRREETASLYRQTYNLWYAEEKGDRL